MIGTVADWRIYATERGYSEPTDATDAVALAALVRASDYITHKYVRYFYSDYTVASPHVDQATYEAALLELATPGFFSKTHTPGREKELVQVDTIKWEVIKSEGGAQHFVPVSTTVDMMLGPYMRREFVIGIGTASGGGTGP